MTTFPSIPGWDGIHPARVQFPIALLWVAPLFLLISLFTRQSWRAWTGSALLLMALGSVAAWFAVGSGPAAGQLVLKTPALDRAIADHEAFGLLTRGVFTVLALVLAALMVLPAIIKKPLLAAARISLHALFLVVYLGCTLAIANTAVRGGRLVHELGVRAMVVQARQPTAQVVNVQAAPGGTSRRTPSDRPPLALGARTRHSHGGPATDGAKRPIQTRTRPADTFGVCDPALVLAWLHHRPHRIVPWDCEIASFNERNRARVRTPRRSRRRSRPRSRR